MYFRSRDLNISRAGVNERMTELVSGAGKYSIRQQLISN